MTLARRILFRNVALLTGLALLAGVALLGLLRLRRDIGTMRMEYAELRVVERTTRHVVTAQGMMANATPDRHSIRVELQAAVGDLDRFLLDQAHNDEGSESHEESETEAIVDAQQQLQRILQDMRGPAAGAGPSLNWSDERQRVDAALAWLNHMIGEADDLVATTQRRAARAAFNTLLAIVGGFVVIVTVSTLIGRQQYRDIVNPLRRLREGARRMAAGRFGDTVSTDGDREFSELAHDFNRMGAELNDLYRTLEEKVEEKSRALVRSERLASVGFLAAGVAHEINNPLGIMSGYAQLTLKRLKKVRDRGAWDDVQRTLEIIRDESFRCRQITEKLLSLSAPGRGERTPVALAEVAEAVTGMVKAHEHYRQRRVHAALDARDQLVALADEAEMKQVLLNLVINALEAVDVNLGEVWVEGERVDGVVRLSVRDNGCGMSPDVREQVFEPFFSGRRSSTEDGRNSGMGLGLSIAHAIVESHGGRLWAESEGVGRGSRFVMELPAVAVEAEVV
jgi:two-component system, NtrC family, sensor kinase